MEWKLKIVVANKGGGGSVMDVYLFNRRCAGVRVNRDGSVMGPGPTEDVLKVAVLAEQSWSFVLMACDNGLLELWVAGSV